MDSPSRAGLTRRRVLALAAGVGATGVAGGTEARALRIPPTLQACVASMEAVMSPEAIDKIAELTEAKQYEYGRGIGYLRQARWGEPWGGAVRGALEAECFAAGFRPDELNDYLVSAIAWRRRGRPLDVAAQLAPFHEAHRHEAERRAKLGAEDRRKGVRIRRCSFNLLDGVSVPFARGSTKPLSTTVAPMNDIARMLVENPSIVHVEVQAHAAPGEPEAGELSRERAIAVVGALVQLGVPTERLTAHGLGTRFPNREGRSKTPGRDADARAELLLLRQTIA